MVHTYESPLQDLVSILMWIPFGDMQSQIKPIASAKRTLVNMEVTSSEIIVCDQLIPPLITSLNWKVSNKLCFDEHILVDSKNCVSQPAMFEHDDPDILSIYYVGILDLCFSVRLCNLWAIDPISLIHSNVVAYSLYYLSDRSLRRCAEKTILCLSQQDF